MAISSYTEAMRYDQATTDMSTVIQCCNLPIGYQIKHFVIQEIRGKGGFGIVYKAYDTKLERTVAIKEYFPNGFAIRNSNRSISPIGDCDVYHAGLRRFEDEARIMSRIAHRGLVWLSEIISENGTAYLVMEWLSGKTLFEYLKSPTSPVTQEWLFELLTQILDILKEIHGMGIIHRDISPDNIILESKSNGFNVKLLDFGASKQLIGDKTQNWTAILKPGYAPFEQYNNDETLQGAHTDIYSLSATLYYVITGTKPQPANERKELDLITPLATQEKYLKLFSSRLLQAIDSGMSLTPETRLKTVTEFAEKIDGHYVLENNNRKKNNKRYAILFIFFVFFILMLALILNSQDKSHDISQTVEKTTKASLKAKSSATDGLISKPLNQSLNNALRNVDDLPLESNSDNSVRKKVHMKIIKSISENEVVANLPKDRKKQTQHETSKDGETIESVAQLDLINKKENPNPILPQKTSQSISASQHASIYITTYSNVSLFQDPNLDSKEIAKLDRDTAVAIMEIGMNDSWVKIKTRSGIEGWVEKKRIQENKGE